MSDEPTERDVVLRIRRAGSIDEAYVLYAERIAQARREGGAEAWDEAVQAMARGLDNGSTEAAALSYVARHNPHWGRGDA